MQSAIVNTKAEVLGMPSRCAVSSPLAASDGIRVRQHYTDSFYDVLLFANFFFHSPQRNSVSDRREAEGCAHMLLGNDSFSMPTQPADSQQDTMAALQATIQPHMQGLCCLVQQLWPWHSY